MQEDSKQQQDKKKKLSTLFSVCPFILGNEFCERLAFYGIASNLVRYFQVQLGTGEAQSSSQVMLWQGTCYLTPVLGAYMADAVWGRYKTILIFSSLYAVGMLLLAASASLPGLVPNPPGHAEWHTYLVYLLALYIVALGAGGIKPNVSSFGADQFDETDPPEQRAKQSFFNWFYFTINLGSMIALTLVTWVQENLGWAIGYLIPGVAMVLALILFVGGSPLYRHIEVAESPIVRVFKVVFAAIDNRRKKVETQRPLLLDQYPSTDLDTDSNPYPRPSSTPQQNLSWLNHAVGHQYHAKHQTKHFTSEQVQEVRLVLGLLPVFLTTVMHATCYIQMSSCFVQQGYAMNMRLPGTSFTIPAASLQAFDALSILVLVPIWDRMVMPFLTRIGMRPTMLQRIGYGMLTAAIAMLLAGIVECTRLQLAHQGDFVLDDSSSDIKNDQLPTRPVNMSVLWQIPQFFLVGTSEVLGFIGYLEFFYDQAPESMRSVCMCLASLNIAIGSYIGVAILKIIQYSTDWVPDNYNKGHLNYYFFLLAGLMMANLLWFMYVASKYQYKSVEHTHYAPLPVLPTIHEENHVTCSIPIEGGRSIETHQYKYGRSLAIRPTTPPEAKLHG